MPTIPILTYRYNIVIFSTFQSLALLTTCFRLLHRAFMNRLGWDDFWALVAFLSDLTLFIAALIAPPIPLKNLILFRRVSWMILLSYTITLWAARLTISVTITRIVFPNGRMNKLSKCASLVFAAFGLILVFHKTYVCARKSCKIPRYTGILELGSDILADLWLILAPAYSIFRKKIRPPHYRLILGIFACGILTSLSSVTHDVFILLRSQFWIGLTGHIQVSIAIIVSNLLVLVTAAYSSIQTLLRARDVRPGVDGSTILSHIDLTEISNRTHATQEQRSVSFLSTAPFSSFSYPTSSYQSTQESEITKIKSFGKLPEEPVSNTRTLTEC